MFGSRILLAAGCTLALGACSSATDTVQTAPPQAAQTQAADQPEKAPKSCSRCAEGKAGKTLWCDHCGKGYVDGKSVGCKTCWAGKSKTSAHAWCDNCGTGHVDGKAVACKKCYDHRANDGPACDVDHDKPVAPGGHPPPPHGAHGHDHAHDHGHGEPSDSKTGH